MAAGALQHGGLIARLVALTITLYQRYLSPHKGYSCAYRTYHGGRSCSQFAKQIVLRRGVLRLFPLLRRRFARCANARKLLLAQQTWEQEGEQPEPPL